MNTRKTPINKEEKREREKDRRKKRESHEDNRNEARKRMTPNKENLDHFKHTEEKIKVYDAERDRKWFSKEPIAKKKEAIENETAKAITERLRIKDFIKKVDKITRKAYWKMAHDVERNLDELPDFDSLYDAMTHAKIGVVDSVEKNGLVVYIGWIHWEPKSIFLPREKRAAGIYEGDMIKIENIQELPTFNSLYDAITHAKTWIVQWLKDNGMMVYIGKIQWEAKAVFLPLEDAKKHQLHTGTSIKIKNLKQTYLYQKKTEEKIKENVKKLPNFRSFQDALQQAKKWVIKSFEDDGMKVYIGNIQWEPEAIFIPRKDEWEKKLHKEVWGDVLSLENRIPKHVFANHDWIKKHNIKINGTSIIYVNNEGKRLEGKIIGYGQNDRRNEVIFLPKKWSQFSINITTLENGMRKAQEKKSLPTVNIENKGKTAPEKKIISKFIKIVNGKKTLDYEAVQAAVKNDAWKTTNQESKQDKKQELEKQKQTKTASKVVYDSRITRKRDGTQNKVAPEYTITVPEKVDTDEEPVKQRTPIAPRRKDKDVPMKEITPTKVTKGKSIVEHKE